MATKYPPYMNSTGLVSQILNKIKTAQTPPIFSQDFLKTVLGFSSGSAMAFIPLLKKIGFLGSDGSPTEIYKRFRNAQESKYAMAEAIKIGYKDLFIRSEYVIKNN